MKLRALLLLCLFPVAVPALSFDPPPTFDTELQNLLELSPDPPRKGGIGLKLGKLDSENRRVIIEILKQHRKSPPPPRKAPRPKPDLREILGLPDVFDEKDVKTPPSDGGKNPPPKDLPNIPEPGSMALLGLGLALLGITRRR